MKQAGTTLRRVLAALVAISSVLLLLFIFFATRSVLDIWARLQELPAGIFYTYMVLIAAFVLGAIWLIWRLLKPVKVATLSDNDNISKEIVLEDIEHAEKQGMDTAQLRRELEELEARKEAGIIYVALFGNVSTGKSSIIKSLLPDADVDIHVRGGSTQDIARYTWTSSSGDKLVLTDLPGRNEADGTLDAIANDEAVRAQLVIYVTDSDLSRTQFNDIQALQSFGKPLIVALNKSDRYNDEERQLLWDRFNERMHGETTLVFVQSGGEEEVIRIDKNGMESVHTRPRKPKIDELSAALQEEIDTQSGLLDNLRDASVFVLVKQKLDSEKVAFRQTKAAEIVKGYTRKAVLGAMASVSPGADLVVQGYLGTRMVKDLCELYNAPVKQLDIDKFLDFSQDQLKKSVPLILAVAGNGLKAFPGIGTVAGGLVHAVAYGMIFDALGKSVTKTLEQRGQLRAAPAALTFKEMLSENLESRAKLFAKLVFEQRQDQS
ncbi:MAG: GTP-binding protein [Proteobacteria bacterium]|nr:MAG: GTP-binding protein [Pseudomonadota bacterium]